MLELVEYVCAHCGGTSWHLDLAQNTETGETHLIITCADVECYEQQRQLNGIGPDEAIASDIFDITGQGRDKITPKTSIN